MCVCVPVHMQRTEEDIPWPALHLLPHLENTNPGANLATKQASVILLPLPPTTLGLPLHELYVGAAIQSQVFMSTEQGSYSMGISSASRHCFLPS